MRQNRVTLYGTVLAVCAIAGVAYSDVAIVIEHQYTIGNDYFSCFAYNTLLSPHEFITTGYGFGKDVRWSRVLDDSVEPWIMEGEVLMTSPEIEFFARDGFASYSLSFNTWGMAFNPLDEKYFIGCISVLKDPFNYNERVDSERDMIQFDPNLPNGLPTPPTGVTVSNVGNYSLVDSTLGSSNGFVASGVQAGDQLTMYPAHWSAEIYAQTYTITQVVDNNTLYLDQDPLWGSSPQVDNTSYILMMQPWLTLATFRQHFPYFNDNPTTGPKAHYKGGLSPDKSTYFVAEIITDNILAVDTQQRETLSVFVAQSTLEAYVEAEIAAGRNRNIHPLTDVVYGNGSDDELQYGWSDESTNTTVVLDNTSPTWDGSDASVAATFTAAGAQLKLHATYDLAEGEIPRDATHYTDLQFWIHGGTAGGQQMTVNLYDHTGVAGTPHAVPPPTVGTWTLVQIPVSSFGVATIGDVVWDNTAGGAQPKFFLDQVEFVWLDPIPDGIYDFDTNGGPSPAQVACDADGRVWFSEGNTDDILWTTDGVTLYPFLTSDTIVAEYLAAGALDPLDYRGRVSNGVQVMGLIVDPMGTVYWSDNQTNSIWKAPAIDPANNIVELATADEIKLALGLTSSPRGMNCFTIRGMELLTFNFVDSNTVYKVDLDTQDYGDLDADFDADLADYAMFQRCFMMDLIANPDSECNRCDIDEDIDVDLDDYAAFGLRMTGPGRSAISQPGDVDGDVDADLADYAAFQRCFMHDLTGPYSECDQCDFDDDEDVDLGDYAKLATFLTGPRG